VSHPASQGDDRAHRLVVLAGPTAVGKGTVSAYVREHFPDVWLSVSATTRHPRPGEVEGVHYHFVDEGEFARMERDGELLESAVVHGRNHYGTPRRPVDQALRDHRMALLEIDLQGARQVKASMPEVRLVFLAPPSWEELVRRLTGRATESPDVVAQRLEVARSELAAFAEFDTQLINSDVDEVADQLVDLMVG
jgi:guanylate kinase